jgi:hypothetical protein
MTQLYLVGTHHLDLKGPERLEKFLGFVRPDTIGLESTVENYHRRIQDHNQLKGQKLLLRLMLKDQYGPEAAENVVKYLDMLGYELWVPSKFSTENAGVRLVHCDEYRKEDIQAMTQEVFGDSVNKAQEVTIDFIEDIAKMDFADYQRRVDTSYQDNFVAELKNDPASFKTLILDRDERAEPKIRQAFFGSNYTMVYVGGTMHFFGDYDNLYDRLKDLNPTRIRLQEIDQF